MIRKHKINCQCCACKAKKGQYNGKNNFNYIDGRSSKKHKCIDCDKEIGWKAKRCNSCSKKELLKDPKNHPNFKGGKCSKTYYCKDCDKKIHLWTALYGKGRCPSCAHKGKLGNRFGKISHGKGAYYKNIYMRSSYEIKFAFFLDYSGIKWLYEPKAFDLGNTTYTPDFYLPKWDLYIEIKGYWRDDAKEKFEKFKNNYPNKNIKILLQKDLQELGAL